MKFVFGRLHYFSKILCFYHSLPEGNQISGRYWREMLEVGSEKFTLMFPIGDKPELQKIVADHSDKKILTIFQTPPLRSIT